MVALFTEIVGVGATVMLTDAVLVHPAAEVAVTV
jgi:hypothetical protein